MRLELIGRHVEHAHYRGIDRGNRIRGIIWIGGCRRDWHGTISTSDFYASRRSSIVVGFDHVDGCCRGLGCGCRRYSNDCWLCGWTLTATGEAYGYQKRKNRLFHSEFILANFTERIQARYFDEKSSINIPFFAKVCYNCGIIFHKNLF